MNKQHLVSCEGGAPSLFQTCSAYGARINDGGILEAFAIAWRAIVSGIFRVVSHSAISGEFQLSIERSVDRCPLGGRRRDVLECALTSSSHKCVGVDREMAASTVASWLHQALVEVGIEAIASRVPFILVVAACASKLARYEVIGHPGNDNGLQSMNDLRLTLHSPRGWLRSRLTVAESEVILLRLAGCSHVETAHGRGRSPRTIANQLGSAYRKLKCSGRAELMILLAEEYLSGNVPREREEAGTISK